MLKQKLFKYNSLQFLFSFNLLPHLLTRFRYRGNISAALVLGGVDVEGSHLYTIYPHGSTDRLPYVTMGSGSLAAMAIFESEYRENMSVSRKRRREKGGKKERTSIFLAVAPVYSFFSAKKESPSSPKPSALEFSTISVLGQTLMSPSSQRTKPKF